MRHIAPFIKAVASCAFLALFLLLSGCGTPQGGSSIPWAKPEPWENQPNLTGVRF